MNPLCYLPIPPMKDYSLSWNPLYVQYRCLTNETQRSKPGRRIAADSWRRKQHRRRLKADRHRRVQGLGKNPEMLYAKLCGRVGMPVDHYLLYVFRCAVCFAPRTTHDMEKLKLPRRSSLATATAMESLCVSIPTYNILAMSETFLVVTSPSGPAHGVQNPG